MFLEKGLGFTKDIAIQKEYWKQMAHSIGERDGPEISKCLRQNCLMAKMAFRPH